MSDDIWPTVHVERRALADDLAGLRAEQWATPSLCTDWTVHEVLAHLLATAKMTPPKALARMAAARFSFHRFSHRQVALESAGGPEATLAAFRAVVDWTSAPPGPKASWLGEALVHGEDIRRPLGIHHAYPGSEVARALAFYAGSNALIGGKRRVAGVTLRATDADVSQGTGPVVEGPVMSLLLAATGRRPALDDLSGPGLELLRSRS